MSLRTFPLLAIALAALVTAVPAHAQEPEAAESADPVETADSVEPSEDAAFTRRYIDADARRSSRVLLRDWPELTRLLTWTRGLESAVVDVDTTLSTEMLAAFRARIDTLDAAGVPEFMAAREDSVDAVLEAVRARLDEAEAALSAEPAEVRAAGGRAENTPEQDRTLVTGKTAVRVPAGVAVGDRDTLPRAEVRAGEPENPIDFVALALSELDRLVHLVRDAKGGVSGPRAP